MFPLLFCLFCDSCASDSSGMFLPDISRVWWNPVESSRQYKEFLIEEGDVLVPSSNEDSKKLKNAIRWNIFLWEKGIIPFEFGENFTKSEESLILEAMNVLEEETCVRFVQKSNECTFIRFQKEKNGCFAPIGKLATKEGPLPVNLQSPECFKEKGIIEHELLHVLGLFHEHSRPDRDNFVTVHWCNIEPQRESDFRKGNFLEMTTFDLPYDYSSIMHYPRWAFSKNGKPTITAKGNPNMTLGQRESPTVTDFQKISKMYKCETK